MERVAAISPREFLFCVWLDDLAGEGDGNGSWFVGSSSVGTPKAGATVLASDRNGLSLSAIEWSRDLLRRNVPRGSFSVGLNLFFSRKKSIMDSTSFSMNKTYISF
jgi:hypothetical protein